MIRRLPAFQGYTIDVRLKEFRKVEWDKLPEFIPFKSEAGCELFDKMQDHPEDIKTYQSEDPYDIVLQVFFKSAWG